MADTDKSLYSLRYNQITSNLEAFGGGSPQWTQIVLNNVDPQQVPITRLINTTAPLQGGGNLSADRTLSIPQATSSVNGFLLAADWTTFNSKLTSILTSAHIFIGNGSNVAVDTALSGDAALANTGALTFNTVNANVGTFTNAQITVNAKGLVTAASSGTIGSLTDVGTDGITITGGTNAVLGTGTTISQRVADSTHNGYLSSTDWSTFNGKQSALTFGNLTDAGTDGITVTGGTGAVIGTGTSLSQRVADTTHNGYLSSTDWTTFNGKQAAGNYITALTGDVTASGPGSVAATLATVNSNVGSFTHSSITVNAKGLITAASSGTAPVTSVSGTTNQISSTGGTTPVLSISSTFVFPGTIDANTHKITNLTNGSAAQDAVAFGQVPVITAGQIVGTATNNNATAGNVGEYISSTGGYTNFPTSTQWGDLTSISLTAGDWDVAVGISVSKNGATVTGNSVATSTASGNDSTGLVRGDNQIDGPIPPAATDTGFALPAAVRYSLSGTTTVYLKFNATYTGGPPQAKGRISARRAR